MMTSSQPSASMSATSIVSTAPRSSDTWPVYDPSGAGSFAPHATRSGRRKKRRFIVSPWGRVRTFEPSCPQERASGLARARRRLRREKVLHSAQVSRPGFLEWHPHVTHCLALCCRFRSAF
jgi:hypothetical protein